MKLTRVGLKGEALWMLAAGLLVPLAGFVIVLVLPLFARGCAPAQR